MSAMQRKILRRKVSNLSQNSPNNTSGEMQLPGGFSLPISLLRKRPFSWLMKLVNKPINSTNSNVSRRVSGYAPNTSKSSIKSSRSQFNKGSHFTTFNLVVLIILCVSSLFLYDWFTKYSLNRLIYSSYSSIHQSSIFETNNSFTSDLISNKKIEVISLSDQSLFWGTYRPNLYFGVKHRSAHSILAGLAWVDQRKMPFNLRHQCNANDNLVYNWLRHDGRHFGIEEIIDNNFKLTVSFLKNISGSRGGDWMTKIKFTSQKFSKMNNKNTVSVMFYLNLPDIGRGNIKPILKGDNLVGIQGFTTELGSFLLEFFIDQPLGADIHHSYFYAHSPREDKLDDVIKSGFKKHSNMPYMRLMGVNVLHNRDKTPESNLIVYEILSEGRDFNLNVVYRNLANSPDFNQPALIYDSFERRFDESLAEQEKSFSEKFERIFPIKSNSTEEKLELLNFGKTVLSNLLGGIGYFHGISLISSPNAFPNTPSIEYGPFSLYTATPSRAQFPRGFLWDEGFHQLLISRWDPDISLDVIKHWFEIMNGEGWIPRELILGWESRLSVPKEFLVQNNQNANPPTLVLPLLAMIRREPKHWLDVNRELFLKILPRLEAWFQWFNRTQLSSNKYSAYRWRGRNSNDPHKLNSLTLTSGLDDYPRASHPTDDERHLDLRCWMALFSQLIDTLYVQLGDGFNLPDRDYGQWASVLKNEELLTELHWSDNFRGFFDWGLHTDAVQLIRPPPTPQNNNPDKIRNVGQKPNYQFITHNGYVSLFPFFTRILEPNSTKLGLILNQLDNDQELWSNSGLRSLSRRSSLYHRHNTEHDPPYWRGAIWINMNALAVTSLRYYMNKPGVYADRAADLYKRLRANLIKLIFGQFKSTGYLWEQYDDTTGNGQRAHPFSGWTSLILLIMAEQEIEF